MKSIKRLLISLCTVLLLVSALAMTSLAAAPGAVTGFSAKVSGTTVTLKWKKVKGASKYSVYSVKPENGETIKKIKTLKSSSLKIKKLKDGYTYGYKIVALSKKNEAGPLSDMVKATVPLKKPTVPKYVKVQSVKGSTATLKWTKPSVADGQTIFRYDENEGDWVAVANVAKKTKTYTVSGLGVGTHKFMIKSYRLVNNEKIYSAASNTDTATIYASNAAVNSVRCPRYKVVAKANITATVKKTGKKVVIAKGTAFTTHKVSGSKVTGWLPDGTEVTLSPKSLSVKGLDSSASNDYSNSVKELFVNSRGFSSNTSWFIWVSEYKFKINVFHGSRGKWKLMKEFPCCSGKASTRTAGGMRKILKKVRNGSYGAPYLWFSPGQGTHANPDGCAFHNYVDSHRNAAVSHGCVRTAPSSLYYLYDNCPVGTAVYVY